MKLVFMPYYTGVRSSGQRDEDKILQEILSTNPNRLVKVRILLQQQLKLWFVWWYESFTLKKWTSSRGSLFFARDFLQALCRCCHRRAKVYPSLSLRGVTLRVCNPLGRMWNPASGMSKTIITGSNCAQSAHNKESCRKFALKQQDKRKFYRKTKTSKLSLGYFFDRC